VRTLPLLPLLFALLAGCAAPAPVARDATVPAARVPLRALDAGLAQYDRAIAALEATEAAWSARARAASIGRDRALDEAAFESSRAQLAVLTRASGAYAVRESAALSSVASSVPQTPESAYRSALLANERRAIAQTRSAEAAEVGDAYALRAAQLDEALSTLALRLTQRDAQRTMLLRLKAEELAASPRLRARAQRDLNAILAGERSRLAAAQAQNARVLAAFASSLAAESSREEARTIAAIRARTAANLAVRARVAPAAAPSVAGPVRMLQSSQSAAGRSASATQTALERSQREFAGRLRTIAVDDEQAAASARDEIARLRAERESLRNDISAYARESAASSARRRHQSNAALSAEKSSATP
jgi:hypothetical protein